MPISSAQKKYNNDEHKNILPKISIVTPSFNQAAYLEETIVSVLSQNYPNLEYIIIDGGSTDGSVDIIRKYEKYLAYWCCEPDRGHGDALNKGFVRSTGEILAWINSDDKYLPWTFSIIAEIFTKYSEVNWLMGFPSFWDEQGRQVMVFKHHKNIYHYLLGDYQWIQQESVFWRRSLWDKVGSRINHDYAYMVDGELWSRFFLHDELWYVDCVLSGYRRHGSNRAALHLQEINAEMHQAIVEMKRHCSEKILNNLKILETVKLLKRYLPKWILAEELVERLYPRLYEEINHKRLIYKDSNWQKRKEKFVIHM
ncbi:MAG: glycosyl transferase [Bacteroidetes bacterium GWF2_43_11]|nr:MAG: glycosyl transferase [Bacteroidetes bacterium GWF2_43_11]